ncbi:MAG TPA: xanthine dehydrogenase family protein subunit M [Caulobacteraceae bacterium]|nr:xanthine dehydrogenase family protein subunit M [Caulobacteraceae bacterium]
MQDFAYHRPGTLPEAVQLRRSAGEASYLAGGMTLIPTLKQGLAQPDALVDLAGLGELAGCRVDGGTLVVGAMTRHATVAESSVVKDSIPALAALAGQIGDRQVRNRGTMGGSVANSDPAADYPAAVIGLGATIRTDRREIAADDYFKDLFETALEPGELIREIAFPIPKRAAYRKFPHPASRFAVAGVFVADFGGGKVRVGVTGAGPCAFRPAAIEQALSARLEPAALDGVAIDSGRFNSDLVASAEFRAQLVRVMAKRAVQDLLG